MAGVRLHLLECLLRGLKLPSHVFQDRLIILEGAPLQLLLVHLHGLRISVSKIVYNLLSLNGGHTSQIICLLQELADADLIHDVGTELLPILGLNLRA
jgi:hypothetical protein